MDEKSVRRLGIGISYHYAVLCNIKLVKAWMKRKGDKERSRRIKRAEESEQG